MTKHECAVIMAFTGVTMLKGNDLDIFYEYVAKILGRPVYTHEMVMLSEEIKEATRNDFVQLCRSASANPKTNADHIRQMSDEELAMFLQAVKNYCIKIPCGKCDFYDAESSVDDIICSPLKWLKQEVSDNATERTD